jgi:dipeptidyl aminopeptidase/acylaminoacyl peptidase
MRRWLRCCALFVVVLPVNVVLVLALTGVPRPPAITAEGVWRVAWRPVLDEAGPLWRSQRSKSLVGWTPDGSAVLVRARRWILDARLHTLSAPGESPEFLPEIPRNLAGVWSAPGREYMVLGWDTDGDEQHRLYRWDLDGDDPVLLTSKEERATFGAFEPGGTRIAYTSTRRNGADFDVYVMDPLDPTTDRRVLEVEGAWGVADWSPSADELLLVHALSNVATELFLLDLVAGTLDRVAGGGAARHVGAQWSRDGTALYYASDRDSEFAEMRRLDLSTETEAVLSGDIPWDVTSVQQSGDGELLLIAVNEDGRTRLYTTDAHGRQLHPLELFDDGALSVQLNPEEPLALVNHTDGLGVTRGYVYDLRSGELTLWAGTERSRSRVPATRLVRYATFDSVRGAPRLIPAFVYPGVGDGPRPVVVDIHGGPEAQARLRPGGDPLQRRGSTGYGHTYASLDDGYLRENAVRDIGALLDWIAGQPDLDADRVAVIGGSYGGYMVLASLVHFGPRIRCGIDVVGISNFVSFLENTADYRRDLRRAEYGDERIPEMRAFLESISPLNNAERITSPLMVVQGANDPRVPVGESRQLVDRVRGNRLEVAYLEGANEGHGFRHPWNALYAGTAEQQMLRACLLE